MVRQDSLATPSRPIPGWRPRAGGRPTKRTRVALVALALTATLAPAGPASAGLVHVQPGAIVTTSTLRPFVASSETLVAPAVSWRRGTWTTTNGVQAVHLLDIDPADPGIGIETAGPAAGVDARATVRTQAARVSRDGHRVVAAVNGDVWWTDAASGARAPLGLQVRAGELLTASRWARPTLGFGADEVPRLGDVAVTGSVTLPDGSTPLVIDRINKPRLSGSLVLYTARWGAATSTVADGTEVVLTGALLPLRVTGTWTGTVATVIPAGGNTPIPADALVLSAQGADATILASLAIGSTVSISTSITPGWEGVVEAIGGREWLLEDGAVGIRPVSTFTANAHPRTAVGIRPDGRLLLATVDGRQPGYSTGVTAADLADLLLAEGATDALMLDGGGSTTTLVRHPGDVGVSLANRPSDGAERAVDNALLVVSSVPTGPLAGLVVRPGSAKLVVGQSALLVAKGVDAAVNGVPVAATSVAWSMDGAGGTACRGRPFRARAPGSATVTASRGRRDEPPAPSRSWPIPSRRSPRRPPSGCTAVAGSTRDPCWSRSAGRPPRTPAPASRAAAPPPVRRRGVDAGRPLLADHPQPGPAAATRSRRPVPGARDRPRRQRRRVADGGGTADPARVGGVERRPVHRDVAEAAGSAVPRRGPPRVVERRRDRDLHVHRQASRVGRGKGSRPRVCPHLCRRLGRRHRQPVVQHPAAAEDGVHERLGLLGHPSDHRPRVRGLLATPAWTWTGSRSSRRPPSCRFPRPPPRRSPHLPPRRLPDWRVPRRGRTGGEGLLRSRTRHRAAGSTWAAGSYFPSASRTAARRSAFPYRRGHVVGARDLGQGDRVPPGP